MTDPDAASAAAVNGAERTGWPLWLYGTAVAALTIAFGVGIMAGLVWISGGSDDVACDGEIELGYAPDLAEQAAAEPIPQSIDARCRWWFSVDADGRLVAYRQSITGRDCDVVWNIAEDRWRCGADVVDETELEEWPSRIEDREDRRSMFVVDFGSP
jgi:hypothetical protein